MMNRVFLIGHLGADPEKTETPTGKTVVRFSLPLHNPFAKKEDTTEWMQCEVWNQPAIFLSQYGKKGDMVVVEGRIRNQRYQSKEGETRYRTFVAVDSLRLRNNRKSGEGQEYPSQNQQKLNQNKPSFNNTETTAPINNQNQNVSNDETNPDDLFKDFDFSFDD